MPDDTLQCAKMAKPIEVPFGLWTRVNRRKHVLLRGGAHWRHLANTTEPFVCGGDAALCQITFTTCYHLSSLHKIQMLYFYNTSEEIQK